jgi:hypothetical protein
MEIKKIVLDCRLLYSSGVGVYLRGILPFFFAGNFEVYLLGNTQTLSKEIQLSNNVHIIECNVKPFSIKELFFFPIHIQNIINSCTLYYTPFFNIPNKIKIPVYTTIHDIIFPDMPQLYSKLSIETRMFFYRRAFRYSRKIFTVSEFSASRIKYYNKYNTQIVVTYSGLQDLYLNKNNCIYKK